MALSDHGIAVIGLGGIARQHIEGYRRHGLRVVAGAEIDPQRLAAAQEKLPHAFLTAHFEEAINRPDVRVVDITVPHKLALRRPVVQAAAEARKAIFIQKPLAASLGEARVLAAIAREAGVPMMVNQNSLFVPGFRAIEPYLRELRAIGTPYYCQIENRNWFDASAHPWFGKDERWILSDMAVHHFALVRHWFGDAATVYAITARDPSQRGIRGETLGVVTIRFKNGVQGVIINNWCSRPGDRLRGHPREDILIQGDRGSISGDSEQMCVSALSPQPAKIYPRIEGTWFPDAFGLAMGHFVESLEAGTPFLCEATDNLKTVALIEAAYRSAAENQVVHVDDLLTET